MDVSGRQHTAGVYPKDVQALLSEAQELARQAEMERRPRFGELAASWLKRISARRVCPDNERRHIGHMDPLAELKEGQLTKAAIEDLFAKLLKPKGPLGPPTINKLRSTGSLIIRDAQANAQWTGHDPFRLVRPLKSKKVKRPTLTLDELVRTLRCLEAYRARLVRFMVLLGPRPGEALGLLKPDVDLRHEMLKIGRSHARDSTKTGKERELPIPRALLADVRAAMRESPCELVFPTVDGRRQRSDTKLTRMLKAGMIRAGIVTGCRYICRRRGCRYKDERREQAARPQKCPKCGWTLWASPIPKQIRFYDLRHTASTLMRKAGVDPLVIQLALGHEPESLTDSVYTHLDSEYVRRELNKLKLKGSAPKVRAKSKKAK